jgi:LuxR family maltose regulon positive regulatory protein
LLRSEQRLARQNPVSCILASLLAEACFELGQTEESRALLAGRLNTIEEYGHPIALISAYMTMARIADQEGRQDQALSLLDALCAIGEKRAMLRLQVAAKCEITRLHARHGRAETSQQQCGQLESLLREERQQQPKPLTLWLELQSLLARTYSSLAVGSQSELSEAVQTADAVAHLAAKIKRDGDAVEAKFLRAEALRRQGAEEAPKVRSEAISLATASGAKRLLLEQDARTESRSSTTAAPAASAGEHSPFRRSGLLTAKEREILVLLSRNLSNKEIALALTVSEQTVKWHVKNLFNKINAGSRKHAVARARLLRLID